MTHQVSRWHLVFGVKSKIWAHFVQELITVGLNTTYLYIIVISSTNKYRKHKNSMLIWALPADEMIVTFKFITVNWWLWRGHWFVVVGFLGGGVWGGGGGNICISSPEICQVSKWRVPVADAKGEMFRVLSPHHTYSCLVTLHICCGIRGLEPMLSVWRRSYVCIQSDCAVKTQLYTHSNNLLLELAENVC